jgi:hypothetical protein
MLHAKKFELCAGSCGMWVENVNLTGISVYGRRGGGEETKSETRHGSLL